MNARPLLYIVGVIVWCVCVGVCIAHWLELDHEMRQIERDSPVMQGEQR